MNFVISPSTFNGGPLLHVTPFRRESKMRRLSSCSMVPAVAFFFLEMKLKGDERNSTFNIVAGCATVKACFENGLRKPPNFAESSGSIKVFLINLMKIMLTMFTSCLRVGDALVVEWDRNLRRPDQHLSFSRRFCCYWILSLLRL